MTQDQWAKLTLAQQFGNIGSELTRARLWEEKNDFSQREKSFERAFDLIDLTIGDRRWIKRLAEITRFREVIADWFSRSKEYKITSSQIENYCIHMTLKPYRG